MKIARWRKNKIIDKYKIRKIKMLSDVIQKKWDEIGINTDISYKN